MQQFTSLSICKSESQHLSPCSTRSRTLHQPHSLQSSVCLRVFTSRCVLSCMSSTSVQSNAERLRCNTLHIDGKINGPHKHTHINRYSECMIEKNKSHIDTCETAEAYCNINISCFTLGDSTPRHKHLENIRSTLTSIDSFSVTQHYYYSTSSASSLTS